MVSDQPEFRRCMRSAEPSSSSDYATPIEQIAAEKTHVLNRWVKKPINLLVPDRSSLSSQESDSDEIDNDMVLYSGPSRVVPDFLVYMNSYPGVFPLVVELKPYSDSSLAHGLNQNLQMLSKC